MENLKTTSIDKLEGQENWTDWKFQIKIQLEVNNVMETVEQKLEIPKELDDTKDDKVKDEHKKKITQLKRNEYIAQSLIVTSVSSQVRQFINMCTTANEMWEKLHSVYEQRTEQRQDRLFNKFFGIKVKDPADSVAKHIAKLEKLWTELQDETWKEDKVKLPESLFLNRVLNTMPEEYFEFLNAWESVPKEYRNLKNLSERLCTVENRLLDKQNSSAETAFSVRKTKFTSRDSSKSTGQFKSGPKCYNCGKYGHVKRYCNMKPNNNDSKSADNQNKNISKPSPSESQKFNKKKADSLLSVLSVNCSKNKAMWIIDSGATAHMSPDKNQFEEFHVDKSLKITVANDQIMSSEGIGDIRVNTVYGEKLIEDAVYVPGIKSNLLSVNKMTEKGHEVVFDSEKCTIYNSEKEVIVTATKEKDLYVLDQKTEYSFVMVDEESQNRRWHKRLGHLNRIGMDLLNKGMAEGISLTSEPDEHCIACLEGKQARLSFKGKGGKRKDETLQLIHSDLCGPMPETSYGGSKYFLTFIDDHTRKIFVYFLKCKNEVFDVFKKFQAFVENQTGKKIKILRTDNGREYVSNDWKYHLAKCGIQHQLTIPHSPAQNGLAERVNRTIVEKARCMMREANCNERYWAEAVNTAAYLANRSPHKAIKENKTPEELWSGKKIYLGHLRVFGCVAYAHVPKCERKKWESKSLPYIFVGYCEDSKGYRLLDPRNPRQITRSRDVAFLENKFSIDGKDRKKDECIVQLSPDMTESDTVFDTNETEPVPNIIEIEEDDCQTNQDNTDEDGSDVEETGNPSNDDGTVDDSLPRQRERKPPSKFSDFILYQSTISRDIPTTYREALASDENNLWEEAMRKEIEAIAKYEVWELVDRPKDQKVIKCKWVYSVKANENGEIVKYKARLVAKGFTQEFGIDYNEVFSPVVCKSSLRVLFALAAKLNLSINHLDINTAFLNGNLEETIYMEQPEGFVDKNNINRVCLLKKALYGLKQASRVWHQRVESELKSLGYQKSKFDPCIFTKMQTKTYCKSFNAVALHVDDFLIFSNDEREKSRLKQYLMSKFSVKDLGKAKFCLGLNIEQTNGKVTINQKTFIYELLKKFNMLDANPVSTPMEVNLKFDNSKAEPTCKSDIPYQSLIGSLLYLSVNSRPDIAFATSFLSQFNSCYTNETWVAAKRILRYLKGTIDLSLTYENVTSTNVVGFVDADWAQNNVDRKSYSGFVFTLCKGPISWESKKQTCVSLSSTEAEYVSLTQASKEAIFLRGFLNELNNYKDPIVIFNDNQSAQKLVYNPIFHSRTKHIDTKFHFIRDSVKLNKVLLKYLSTKDMLADIFTKALPKTKHQFCTKGMGLQE